MPLTPSRSEASRIGPPQSEASRPHALEALLRDLGGQVRPGGSPAEPPGRWPTGFHAVDQILGGGLPRGQLAEIIGPPSSGRTALAFALLATATRAGELVAWVDVADAFDPPSARAAGVELARVLWVRAPRLREALRSTERLLEARGFAGVVVDAEPPWLPSSTCLRLRRQAAASGTAVVLLAPRRAAGSFSELVLEAQRARARFDSSPAWLAGLETRIELTRSRVAPAGAITTLKLRALA